MDVIHAATLPQERSGESTGGTPSPFDPVDEYRQLLELTGESQRRRIQADPITEPDVYSELMSREQRVLDTVDRVVNDAVEKRHPTITSIPIHEIIMRTLGTVHSFWDDLIMARSLDDVITAMKDPSRTLYFGIALVSVAAILSIILVM